jgi:hypothetical protein
MDLRKGQRYVNSFCLLVSDGGIRRFGSFRFSVRFFCEFLSKKCLKATVKTNQTEFKLFY